MHLAATLAAVGAGAVLSALGRMSMLSGGIVAHTVRLHGSIGCEAQRTC
jgi:hypothetical protein